MYYNVIIMPSSLLRLQRFVTKIVERWKRNSAAFALPILTAITTRLTWRTSWALSTRPTGKSTLGDVLGEAVVAVVSRDSGDSAAAAVAADRVHGQADLPSSPAATATRDPPQLPPLLTMNIRRPIPAGWELPGPLRRRRLIQFA